MAGHYKLTYFPVQALGEPIRMLLSYGGIEFEDYRFQRENWPSIKPKTPFGQVPILEVDGKVLAQSGAICRYIAKLVKLTGSDPWEDAQIDAVVDAITDFRQKIALFHYEPDEQIKESRREPLYKETIPFYIEKFESIAKANNGHLVGGKLTWADVYLTGIISYLNDMVKLDLIADSPNLKAVVNNVENIPTIKAWIEKRPPNQ